MNGTKRGDLVDCQVRIQQKKTVVDRLEHVEKWTDIGATEERQKRYRHAYYARYQGTGSAISEKITNGITAAFDLVTLTMDYIPDVDATCRVLFRGREDEPFSIIAPPENLHYRNRTMILRIRRTEAG